MKLIEVVPVFHVLIGLPVLGCLLLLLFPIRLCVVLSRLLMHSNSLQITGWVIIVFLCVCVCVCVFSSLLHFR